MNKKLFFLLFIHTFTASMNSNISYAEKNIINLKLQLIKQYEGVIDSLYYLQWHGSKDNQNTMFICIKHLKQNKNIFTNVLKKQTPSIQQRYNITKTTYLTKEEQLINKLLRINNDQTLKEEIKKIPSNKKQLCLRCLFCFCCNCLY